MTKTFNIGERCVHGTIILEVKGVHVTLKVCDYKTKNVRVKEKFHFVDKHLIREFLWDKTSDYFVDKIMDKIYV